MEILLRDLPLEKITTSMTINSPAPVIWALFIAAAEKRGMPRAKLAGTLQNDILKEYIAQNEYIYSPEHSMRLVTDTIEFAANEMPLWNPVSVSGYHIREAGSTAAQELAFTLADGIEYVKWALARGLDIDAFAAADQLLLQQPQRLLRGGREVPRGAAHLGAADARTLRREERSVRG